MKIILLVAVVLSGSYAVQAQSAPADTTVKSSHKQTYTSIEKLPSYPGGIPAFNKMIVSNLKYPELAELIGINGRVNVSFVVDTSGRLTDITPLNCIGAGCESEAVKALSMSKQWQPGVQNSKFVRVQYTVPISFTANKPKVNFKELRNSKYGFVFEINGARYNIDKAEEILGKTFNSSHIEIAIPYTETDKFAELAGKEVYLIKIKSNL